MITKDRVIDLKKLEVQKTEEIRCQLNQLENVFHNRFYFSLVAQTLLISGSLSHLDDFWFLGILASAGILFSFLFLVVNLRSHVRIMYLVYELKERSRLYKDYMNFESMGQKVCLTRPTDFLHKMVNSCISSSRTTCSCPPNACRIIHERFLGTGTLFSWGGFLIFFGMWTALLLRWLLCVGIPSLGC